MNKWTKTILRIGAFLISTAISASLFGLLSLWAWTQLDPVQQETIAATNARWDVGLERWKLPSSRQIDADRDESIEASTKAATSTHLH